MKGVKIGIKEGIIIFIALAVMTNFFGSFLSLVFILALLLFNAYLRNKEKKAEKKNSQNEQQK